MLMISGVSRGLIGSAAASVSLLGYTVASKPDPYPPLTWSIQSKEYPDHVAMGLGPFHYFFPEKGATSPIDRIPEHLKSSVRSVDEMKCMKPGLNAPSDVGDLVSGLIATDSRSYHILESRLKHIRLKLAQNGPLPRQAEDHLHSKPESTVTLSLKRNLKDKKFNSYTSFTDRRDIEEIIVNALEKEFEEGSYFPLRGSKSCSKKTSMSKSLEDLLRSKGLIFDVPWSVYDLSCGYGRHWPDARGVFILPSAENTEMVVFVNSEDHMHVVAKRTDGDSSKCLSEIQTVAERIQKHINYAKNDLNGFLTLRPEDSGTGLDVSHKVGLNRLHRHAKFLPLCEKLRLKVLTNSSEVNASFHLVNFERFTLSSEEAAQRTDASVALIQLIDKMLSSPKTEQEGLHLIDDLLVS